MRRIHKQREPECLAATRRDVRSSGAPSSEDWGSLSTACKDAVRQALAAEQLGLCAYCMRRIEPKRGARDDEPRKRGMRVEHWTARSDDPSHVFEWSNLLGVCGGILETAHGVVEHTCDKVRGDRPLELHPAHRELDVQALFRYTAEGEVRSDDPRARHDIETLNLEARTLRARRREVWQRQGDKLRRSDSLGTLRRMLENARTPGKDGRLPPFAAVVEYYATRKLQRRGAKP